MRGGYRNFGKWGGGGSVLKISYEGSSTMVGGNVLENFENQTPQTG